jgi:hypothetical protein
MDDSLLDDSWIELRMDSVRIARTDHQEPRGSTNHGLMERVHVELLEEVEDRDVGIAASDSATRQEGSANGRSSRTI